MTTFSIVVTVALGLLFGGPGSDHQAQPGNQPGIEAKGGGGRCPRIYAPVTCDNGKTYPNQCEADRHNAQNCVPSGGL